MRAVELFVARCAGGSPAGGPELRGRGRRCRHARRLRHAKMRSALRILWAAPWSLLGLLIGVLGLLSGGHVQRKHRTVEFWGGCLPAILSIFPFYSGSPVATFGSVVVGRSDRYLDACRKHQMIHVRQYERWGLLFVPAYLACSLALWFRGKRPYYDNPFERSAFQQSA